jgi:hypothetical protein
MAIQIAQNLDLLECLWHFHAIHVDHMLLIEKYVQMQNMAQLNILLWRGVGVVHSFEYSGICSCDMKSRTMLCNFYKELSIPIFGEEKYGN